jgi:hypothetical protein
MYDGGGWPLLPRMLDRVMVKKGRDVRRTQMGSLLGWAAYVLVLSCVPLVVPDVACAGLAVLAHPGVHHARAGVPLPVPSSTSDYMIGDARVSG